MNAKLFAKLKLGLCRKNRLMKFFNEALLTMCEFQVYFPSATRHVLVYPDLQVDEPVPMAGSKPLLTVYSI